MSYGTPCDGRKTMKSHFVVQEIEDDTNANIHKKVKTSRSIVTQNCNSKRGSVIPSISLPNLKLTEEVLITHEIPYTNDTIGRACPHNNSENDTRKNISSTVVTRTCCISKCRPNNAEFSPKPSDNPLVKPKQRFQRTTEKQASDSDITAERSDRASQQNYLIADTDGIQETQERFDMGENKDPHDKRKPDPPRRQFLDHLIIGGRRPRIQFLNHVYFINPAYKSQFLSKVMAVKVVKWTAASVLTMVTAISDLSALKKFPPEHVWTVSIPLCGYFAIFVSIRIFSSLQKKPWVALLMILQILCISYAAYAFHCIAQTPVVPMILLTLIWTYFWIGILSAYRKMDLTQDIAVPLVLVLILSFSGLYYLLMKFVWFRLGTSSVGHQIGTVWLPTVMMMQSLTLMEMAELKALIEGYRIELGPTSYLIVATFLI